MADEAAEWKEKIKQWNNGIDLEEATAEDIQDYAATKIYTYKLDDCVDADMWDAFCDEFEGRTKVTFNIIPAKQLGTLRRQLRTNGVFVQSNGKNITLVETLLKVLNEEERHKWTNEEMTAACNEVVPLRTRQLRSRVSLSFLHQDYRLEPINQPSGLNQHTKPSFGHAVPSAMYSASNT